MIGERIKNLRKEQGLSQEDLAKQLFISRQAVSLWEKGESYPSIDNLLMLKKLYGISIDEWLSDGEVVCGSKNNGFIASGNSADSAKKCPKSHKKLFIGITCAVVALIIAIMGICNLSARNKILYPLGKTNYNITKISPIIVENFPATSSHQLVFENANIQIEATLPDGYIKNDSADWLFNDENDNFVRFVILSKEQLNPFTNSKTDEYLNKLGLNNYLSRCLYALSADISSVNAFSSARDIYVAGAVRCIRSILGVENTCYSDIFMKNAMGITVGFALQWDYAKWSIYWHLGENLVLNVIIRDADIAKNPNTLATFLSSFQFSVKYASAQNS